MEEASDLEMRQMELLRLYHDLRMQYGQKAVDTDRYRWQKLVLDQRLQSLKKAEMRQIEASIVATDAELGKYRRFLVKTDIPSADRVRRGRMDERADLEWELEFLKTASAPSYVKFLSRKLARKKYERRFSPKKGQSNSFVIFMLPVLAIAALMAYGIFMDVTPEPLAEIIATQDGIQRAMAAIDDAETGLDADFREIEAHLIAADADDAADILGEPISRLSESLYSQGRSLADAQALAARQGEAIERLASRHGKASERMKRYRQTKGPMDKAIRRYIESNARLEEALAKLRKGDPSAQGELVNGTIRDIRATLEDIKQIRKEIRDINRERLAADIESRSLAD